MKPEDFEKLPHDNEYQQMLSSIYFTHTWLLEKYQAIFKKYGITVQQYNVLGFLGRIHPASADLQTVKSVLIEKADATRLIARLKDKGLLTSKVNPANKRKIEIRLTSSGKKLHEKILGEAPAFWKQVATRLKPKDAKLLIALLEKVRE
jgi:DNA-binding MarR family transcriptional regulator